MSEETAKPEAKKDGKSHVNGVHAPGKAIDAVGAPTSALDVGRLMTGVRLVVLGGTGFLGKVFWLMLLDRYPQIGKIYLLVRGTTGLTSEERFFRVIVKNEAFRPLRDRYGDGFDAFIREKVVPIDGDVGQPLSGVSEPVLDAIAGTIDVVVNIAGVVDFNPPLDEALDANAFGAQNLLALTRRIRSGKAGSRDIKLMHTSTCYVAGRRKGPIAEVDPRTIPFPRAGELGIELWDPDREIEECLDIIREAKHRADDAFRQSEFAEKAKQNLVKRGEPTYGEAFDAEVSRVKRKYLDARLIAAGKDRAVHWGWPNIYTYTKSIGEQVIAGSGLPCTIVRPACCEATLEFPFPGWNEGISTSAPHTYLIMKGHMTIPSSEAPLDLIPTDLVTSGMVMALAELLEGTAKPVYHFGIADVNAASIVRLGELIGLYRRKHFQKKSKGNPLLNLAQSRLEPIFITPSQFEMSSSPAISAGARGLAKIMRGVPALSSLAQSLNKVADGEDRIADLLRLFVPFTAEVNGPFTAANVRAAYARLSPEDRTKLRWDPEKLDYADWMMNVQLPAFERWVMPQMDAKVEREKRSLRPHPTLVHLIDEMAERHGLSVALGRLEADGFSRVTFADVKARSIAVTGRLQAAGVAKGDTVVLMGQNHPDWSIAAFGVFRAGAAVVPVDPAMDAQGLARILAESGARAIVWDAESATKHAGGAVNHRFVFDLHELTAAEGAPAATPVDVVPTDIASVLFTSGTTGVPKGVKLTHANFTSLAAQLAPLFPLRPGDSVLSVLPLHHTFEFTCGLILPLSRGARVHYLDGLTGDHLARALELGKVTAMVGVPALWQLIERRILATARERGSATVTAMNLGADLNRALGRTVGVDVGKLLFGQVHAALGGNVKYLISGGAALPKETQERFAGWGLPLFEGYGLTEAGPVLTVNEPGKAAAGVVGRAIPGVELKILEPDATGVGEVLARGPNVMAGYTDPAATARTLDAEGWLHTGDLGRLDAKGRLSLAGRSDDVIIGPAGENIHPDDLEALIGEVPYVAELAVVRVVVDGAERVACLAVPEPGDDERETRHERARGSLRAAFERLPYGKRPAVLHLYDAKLPRTATRKVRRPEVAEVLGRLMAATAKAPPDGLTNPVRVAISAIRQRPIETIASGSTLPGDLGFDSLSLAELHVALEAKFGSVDTDALQACTTVGDVEALVGVTQESRRGPVVRRARIESGDEAEHIVLPVPLQEAGKRFIGALQDVFYGQLMTARVYGRAFIPQNRNTIVVANHASHLDMGFVRHALGPYGADIVSLAAQDYFFEKSPIRRAFFENLTNLQAIDRTKGLRASERQAAEILKQGKTMLIFPEGTRSPDGDVHEFKPLVGHLALTYGVDILPVYISGTREAMPKGARIPTRRDLTARIGLPLTVAEMKRLTHGMTPADAAREASRLAFEAIVALRARDVLDLTTLSPREPDRLLEENAAPVSETAAGPRVDEPPREPPAAPKKKDHPLVTLFTELGTKFKPGSTAKPVSFDFTLGGDAHAKWTVRVDRDHCDIRPGKPEGDAADCVLKTTPEIFEKIVREAYVPGPAEFLSGAVKSNDIELLLTFQKVFELG